MTSRTRLFITTIAAALGVLITALLGQWQLTRAATRERVQASIEEQGRLPPVPVSVLQKLLATGTSQTVTPLLHRRVLLKGQWMPQHSVFLDNRQMQGKPGFFVLTPLRIEGTSAVVVVQRGWVARNFLDRNQLPRIPTASGLVEVSGRLEGPPPRLLDLGGKKGPPDDSRAGTSSGSKGSPDIRQNLALDSFADETKLPVLPLTVVQTKPAAHIGADAPPDGLLRDWPQVSSGASKNYGYAAQWFALSVLIAGLYLWFQFGKAYVAKKRS